MSKKKKKIILLVSLIVSIALVFAIVFKLMFSGSGTFEDTYSSNIKIMNEHNVSLVIYGDEITFRDGVKYKTINEISKPSFNGNEYLVINDRSSNTALDDEDYTEIKELISSGVTFIYIGGTEGSKLETFKEKGFFSTDNINFLGFRVSAISFEVTTGIWSYKTEEAFKKNDEFLGEQIVSSVVSELRKKEWRDVKKELWKRCLH